jgi:acyl-coenzyme A synthetase/AMP-(fatty) acid ligase
MTGGALCLLPHSSTPSSMLNAIQSKQLNALAFQPRHITALMQECSERLSEITTNIQYIASASAGLDVSLLTSLGDYFQNTKIIIYYALTEAPRAVCAINPINYLMKNVAPLVLLRLM